MDRFAAEVRAAAAEVAEAQKALDKFRQRKDRLLELDELRLWFLDWTRRAAAARFRAAVQAQIKQLKED